MTIKLSPFFLKYDSPQNMIFFLDRLHDFIFGQYPKKRRRYGTKNKAAIA